MKRDYGKDIRKYIFNNYRVNKIVSFEDKQMFSSATTYTGIFMFNKSSNRDGYIFNYKKLKCNISSNLVMSKIIEDENVIENIEVESKLLVIVFGI